MAVILIDARLLKHIYENPGTNCQEFCRQKGLNEEMLLICEKQALITKAATGGGYYITRLGKKAAANMEMHLKRLEEYYTKKGIEFHVE